MMRPVPLKRLLSRLRGQARSGRSSPNGPDAATGPRFRFGLFGVPAEVSAGQLGIGAIGLGSGDVIDVELMPGETVTDWCARWLVTRLDGHVDPWPVLGLLEHCSEVVFTDVAAQAAALLQRARPDLRSLIEALGHGDAASFDGALSEYQRLAPASVSVPTLDVESDDSGPAVDREQAGVSLRPTADGFVLGMVLELGSSQPFMTCGEQVMQAESVVVTGDRVEVEFRLGDAERRHRHVASGAWSLRHPVDGRADASCPPVKVLWTAQVTIATPLARVTAYATEWGTLAVRIEEPRPVRTPSEELRARQRYGDGGGLRPRTVFAECFGGKQVGDSPLAITDALAAAGYEGTIWWSVDSLAVEVPTYATALLRETPEWYEALAGAQFILNNTMFPWWFCKRPGQTYIQTWHGSPWKRIGLDQPRHGTTANYREILRTEPQQWDYLLAAGEEDAAAYATAFVSPAEVLIGVLPRNDALLDAGPEQTADARLRLGIDVDANVTLYLPTWRERSLGVAPRHLDAIVADYVASWLEAAADTDLLLVRAHHESPLGLGGSDARVRDVTTWPQINDLYLASDRLVTDYSSALFDYALLRRHLDRFAPDHDYYATYLRGLYARGLDHPPMDRRLTERLANLIREPVIACQK